MISADDYVLQILEDYQYVTPDIIEAFRTEIEQSDDPLDVETKIIDKLVEQEYLTFDQITALLASEFGMELVDMTHVNPPAEVMELVPLDIAEKHNVFPLQMDGSELEVAIADPLDQDTLDGLGHRTGMMITPRLATPGAIRAAIDQHYDKSARVDDMFSEFADMGGNLPTGNEPGTEDDQAPIIRYVNLIITEAIKRRTSDIHLEPLEKRFRIRYRIDGVLQEVENPPKRLQSSIITRLKLMANVSIAEKRIPQDGRIQVKTPGKDLDLRVSVLPTAFGESIVMRILDKEGLKLGLPELGFFSDDQGVFERIIRMPDGVFLVTGPTGSGKSTTLYSALNVINQPDTKIITVEDPVEYQLSGINQVQVRKEVGMTFSSALRAMLRQAPNIVMVGEIRDRETAEIAINASLTGHMVFSTLHTNDAPSAVTRLVDIGVKPYLVAAALRGALAQRLVRKIHPDCKQPYEPDIKELNALGLTPAEAENATFYQAVGNAHVPTGYKGRNGIFEIFVMNDELQQMIYEGATLVELRNKARELGMRSMKEDGLRKVTAGVTTISELLHVTV